MQDEKGKFKYRIGFVASAFDMLHAGHMRMLRDAKDKCFYLIVALQEDPSITPKEYRGKKKDKPIMSLEERIELLKGCRYVDEVVVYRTEEDLLNLLKDPTVHIDIRILGSDWEGKEFTGHNLTTMQYYFHNRDHNWSTTELKQRVYESEKCKN